MTILQFVYGLAILYIIFIFIGFLKFVSFCISIPIGLFFGPVVGPGPSTVMSTVDGVAILIEIPILIKHFGNGGSWSDIGSGSNS